jgi:N-acetylglucosamine-6-sulfatase
MRRVSLLAGLIALAASSVQFASTAVTARSLSAPKTDERPNIIVVMTDDQDVASVKHMPHVQELIADEGATFSSHTVVFPLCCPSRSAYLSGQVGHNNHIRGNGGTEGGYSNLNHEETYPVWLSDAGYVTNHLGKFPNGYDGSQHLNSLGVPPGWTEWHGAVDPSTYVFYGYTLNENGINTPHGFQDGDYQTDTLTDIAVDYIERRSEGDEPFFLDVAYLAPHWEFKPGTGGRSADFNPGDVEGGSGESSIGTPPVPAPRHVGASKGIKAPRPPSFNEEDVSDKPSFIQNRAPLTQRQIDQVDRWYQKRIESLQAVDEGVARIIQTLEETGELDNTYVVFTADNGWLQGEHRIALEKVRAYNESATVPLIVRGPGVKHGVVSDNTSNIDLTATILDLAGARAAGHELDGMSLTPYLSKPRLKLGRVVFGETESGTNGYYAVKTDDWKYVEHNNGDVELYDRQKDPFELTSLHADPNFADLIAELSAMIEDFKTCEGAECVVSGVEL